MVFRALKVLFLVFLLTAMVAESAFAARRSRQDLIPDPKKYAAVVVHADTGVLLHDKNATKVRYPASLAKMMTLYLVFEALEQKKLSLSQSVYVSKRAERQPKIRLGLRRGERIKVRDAISAIVVRSANDVAVVMAEAVAGSEDQFAKTMTKRARELGMKDTTFKNSSGLFDEDQVTTAKDMAKLIIALQRDFPKYYSYLSQTYFKYKGRKIVTHNKVLTQYKGSTGGKTGYINASGFNLASSARRRNQNIVAVVLGGKTAGSRDKILMSLLDKGFNSVERASAGKLKKFAAIPAPRLRPWQEPASIAATDIAGGKKQAWSIELGGFGAENEAIKAVSSAMDLAPEQLAFSQVDFVNKTDNGVPSHWAKFISLTENQAKQACLALATSSSSSCHIVDEQ